MKHHRTGPTTARLDHRQLVVGDAEAFFALNSHPEVMRFTGEPPLGTVEEARDAIAHHPDFDTVGYGRWACVLRETGAVIGFCGLKYLDDLDVVDIGFRFLPSHYGKGLATEAAKASLAFGFDVLSLDRIHGFVMPGNAASVRVLEKIGMHSAGSFHYDGTPVLRFVSSR